MFEMHQMQDLIDISQGKMAERRLLINRAHRKKTCRQRVTALTKLHIYKGSEYNIRELADIAGYSSPLIRQRLTYGWSVEDAVEKPLQASSR